MLPFAARAVQGRAARNFLAALVKGSSAVRVLGPVGAGEAAAGARVVAPLRE
jgi:hypothetical protein